MQKIFILSVYVCFVQLALFAQSDSVRSDFQMKVEEMVDSLHLSDTTKIQFYEIYKAYGETMRVAYENKTSWIGLNHTYQWAIRERDTQMKTILSTEQLYYFKKRQREIESEARKSREENP